MRHKLFWLLIFISLEANAQYLFGTTTTGGPNGAGVMFKVSPDGTEYSDEFDFNFTGNPGKNPESPLLNVDGKFYGVTSAAGVYNVGVLFVYDPVSGIYTALAEFNPTLGSKPQGPLIQALNGKIYGVTQTGGANDAGSLFEYDITANNLKKIIDFDTEKGKAPVGGLGMTSDGMLYGLTSKAGENNSGTLYQFDPTTDAFLKKIDLSLETTGSTPIGGLTVLNDLIYGTTSSFEHAPGGSIFIYDPSSNEFTVKFKMTDTGTMGNSANSNLIIAPNGKWYGTARFGGPAGQGVLFEYDPATGPDGTLTIRIDFGATDYGTQPTNFLTLHSNGKIYGMLMFLALDNSAANPGLYEFDPVSLEHKKIHEVENGGGLVEYNGLLYGTSRSGGDAVNGSIYTFNPSNDEFKTKISIGLSANGYGPNMYITQASNDKLYGIAFSNKDRLIYEYDLSSQQYSVKALFDDYLNEGRSPVGKMVEMEDGKMYGVTNGGGEHNLGTIFQFDPEAGTIVKKYDFDGIDGQRPGSGLQRGPNGNLYGLATGSYDDYTAYIFEYNPASNEYHKRGVVPDVFQLSTNGITLADNGKFYGTTQFGGSLSAGSIFEFDPVTNDVSVKVEFDYENGGYPDGSLTLADNGKLYGTNSYWVGDNRGSVFEFDPATADYKIVHEFDGIHGQDPSSSLTESNNGKLYGLTSAGGANNRGILYELDPAMGNFSLLHDFDPLTGSSPAFGSLTFVEAPKEVPTGLGEVTSNSTIAVFPNPVADELFVRTNKANLELTIFDMLGQRIGKVNAQQEGLVSIDVKGYKTGLYIISVGGQSIKFQKK